MAANKITSLDDYVDLAKTSPEEVDLLFKDLLISVTSFFRDPSEYVSIRSYINKILKAKKGDQIRLWVPGAATGQEAYSLAMLFADASEVTDLENLRLQIFATDIDVNAIETARRGYYTHAAMEQVPAEYIQKYFDPAPTGYIVKKSLREKIVFSYHNIFEDPPFLNIDMISCRNLLIYFQAALQAEVFPDFTIPWCRRVCCFWVRRRQLRRPRIFSSLRTMQSTFFSSAHHAKSDRHASQSTSPP
jgi:two-component system CheB/CheR fusion protein